MNIEISSEEYWKELNYYDGILYCSLLVIDGVNDWRMMTNREWRIDGVDIQKDFRDVWLVDDVEQYPDMVHMLNCIIPVRSI